MTTQNIEEIFSLPIGTVQIANVAGWPLYSSDRLKKSYAKAMEKQSKTKAIGKHIAKMVEKKQINPCWLNRSVLGLLKHKFATDINKKAIAAFYYPPSHKIFILIDNSLSFLTYTSNIYLANVTLHESMHMAANKMKMGFLSHFRTELTLYYSALFSSIFQIEGEDISKEAQKIYTFLFKESELKRGINLTPFLKKYYQTLDESFRKYKQSQDIDQFDKQLRDYITFLTIYLKGDTSPLLSAIPHYRPVFRSMYSAYERGLGAKGIQTLCIQELFVPSEVICIYSEITKRPSKIYSAFKKIK